MVRAAAHLVRTLELTTTWYRLTMLSTKVRTCMTMTRESFCNGPYTSSLNTFCLAFCCSIRRRISEAFRPAEVETVSSLAFPGSMAWCGRSRWGDATKYLWRCWTMVGEKKKQKKRFKAVDRAMLKLWRFGPKSPTKTHLF